jgi:PAS domain S-box-containing protein
MTSATEHAEEYEEYRVLLLPATRRDAEVTTALLKREKLLSVRCDNAASLARELDGGVGAILMTDDALADPGIDRVLEALGRQPPWSDVPAIVLCGHDQLPKLAAVAMRTLRNVTVLERPTTSRTLISAVRAALRARARQYQMRGQFTTLQESEAAVRLRERQLRTLAENTPDILSRFDRQLRHVYVNQAATEVTGLSNQQFLGRTHREIGIPAELCDQWERALRETFTDGQRRRLVFTYPGERGARHYDSLLIPEMGDSGTIETVLSVAHDATETQRSALILEEASRRKDEFLAMLAHELRNPLAPIRNASEILARKLADDPQMKRTVNLVKRQVTHLARLVDDLLDVSRITQGRIELRRAPQELAPILAQARESVEPLLREKKHVLLVSTSFEPLYVYGDHARLVQSVANVLTNAAKYTDPGGEIRLELRRQSEQAVIVVSDTGVGIAPELLPRVFDLFVQGDRSLDRSQGGLGIGLSVVKRLVEMHHGRVTACSEGPGRGSVFEIHLPLIEAPAGSQAHPSDRTIQTKRILIVDDNVDAANSLAEMLQIDGHITEVVYTGRDALSCALARPADVILLDIGLPDMNGYEVAARMRPKIGPAQLIALTGYGQTEDVRKATEAGFDAHLIKPVDFDELERIIAEFGTAKPRETTAV